MSTIKISQLPIQSTIEANTANTIFVVNDTASGITGSLSASVLAQGLYANNTLVVGNNRIVFTNTSAQFSGFDPDFSQINIQNFDGIGSGDAVVTADIGTNSTYYVDMGIAGSTYNVPGYTVYNPLDGYLMVSGAASGALPGGNLVIGTLTPNKDITFFQGGSLVSNQVAKFSYNNGLTLLKKPITFADGSSQNTAAATLTYTQAAFTAANVANAAIVYQTGVNATQNTAITSAVNVANAALPLSGGTITGPFGANGSAIFNGTVAINSTTTINGNTTIVGTVVNDGNSINNGNTVLNGTVLTTGVVTIGGSLIPSNTNISLGTANNPFNSLYISNSAVTFANANVAVTGTLGVSGVTTFAGNVITNGLLNVNGVMQSNGVSTFTGSSLFTGNVTIQASSYNANVGAFEIIGSTSGSVVTPAANGYMVHVTGLDGVSTKVVIDNFGSGNTYPLYVGRAGRGNAGAPTATQNGDVIARYAASSYGTTGFLPLGTGNMQFSAIENQTDTNRGTQWSLNIIPIGSNTLITAITANTNTVAFANTISPTNGIINNVKVGSSSPLTINFTTDTLVRANLTANFTITPASFIAGKTVEVWLTNNSVGGPGAHTITHGITNVNNTTNGGATFSLAATQTARLVYMCADGTLANTFVAITSSGV